MIIVTIWAVLAVATLAALGGASLILGREDKACPRQSGSPLRLSPYWRAWESERFWASTSLTASASAPMMTFRMGYRIPLQVQTS